MTIYSPDDGSLSFNQRFNDRDCKSGGRVYSEGAKWHPIIGPFGQMECVVCTCKSGNVECSRINCPPAQKLACIKPKRVQGQCCLICTNDDDGNECFNTICYDNKLLHFSFINFPNRRRGKDSRREGNKEDSNHTSQKWRLH